MILTNQHRNFLSAFLLSACLCGGLAANQSAASDPLVEKQWSHGSKDCTTATEPAIEVYRYSESSFILRQSKCLSYEAPFMYLLLGDERALLLDSGATEEAADFPLYTTVAGLIGERELILAHSHGHAEHRNGDAQFHDKPGVSVVSTDRKAVMAYFNFIDWPNQSAQIDLGDRLLTVIPAPGHQEESIAVYDPRTEWLLTGDTIYPGYIYVKDWDAYRDSVNRLQAFAQENKISALLGAHIEMTKQPGEGYPVGTSYQPEEAPLPMEVATLHRLHSALQEQDPREISIGTLVVRPMNPVQKSLSNIVRWFSQ